MQVELRPDLGKRCPTLSNPQDSTYKNCKNITLVTETLEKPLSNHLLSYARKTATKVPNRSSSHIVLETPGKRSVL